jgi:hypothetical protein
MYNNKELKELMLVVGVLNVIGFIIINIIF